MAKRKKKRKVLRVVFDSMWLHKKNVKECGLKNIEPIWKEFMFSLHISAPYHSMLSVLHSGLVLFGVRIYLISIGTDWDWFYICLFNFRFTFTIIDKPKKKKRGK